MKYISCSPDLLVSAEHHAGWHISFLFFSITVKTELIQYEVCARMWHLYGNAVVSGAPALTVLHCQEVVLVTFDKV